MGTAHDSSIYYVSKNTLGRCIFLLSQSLFSLLGIEMGLCGSSLIKTLEKEAIEELKKAAPAIIDAVADKVKEEIPGLVEAIGNKIEEVVPEAKSVIDAVEKVAETHLPAVVNIVEKAAETHLPAVIDKAAASVPVIVAKVEEIVKKTD
jgi:hypothetical protein